jgi:hypothetical protein
MCVRVYVCVGGVGGVEVVWRWCAGGVQVVSSHAGDSAGGCSRSRKTVVTAVAVAERQFTLRIPPRAGSAGAQSVRRERYGGHAVSGRVDGMGVCVCVCVRGMTLQRCVVVAAMTVRDAACTRNRSETMGATRLEDARRCVVVVKGRLDNLHVVALQVTGAGHLTALAVGGPWHLQGTARLTP